MVAKAPKNTSTAELRRLKAENKRLAAENSALKTKTGYIRKPRPHAWRSFTIMICVALAGALLVVGNVAFWMGRTIVDNDRYAAVVEPLIREPAVQEAVAHYTTQKVYENVDVEQKLSDTLPDKAKPLAPIIAPQVKSITQTALLKVLQNPSFQDTWNKAQINAHDRTVKFVKNYQGDGTIDIAEVYKQLSGRLDDTRLGFLANKNLPDKVGSITVAHAEWLPAAHNLVVNLELYRFLTVLAVILLTVLAVWLSRNRRRLVIRLGIFYAMLMFLSLVSYKILQQQLMGNVAPEYRAAVEVISGQLLRPLVIQTRTILLVGLLVSLVAWLSGPSRVAHNLRGKIQEALDGHLHQALFHHENAVTEWFANHRRILQWLAVAVVAVIMLSVQLNPALVVSYAILMLLLVLVVELIAAPREAQTVRRPRKP